METGPSFSVIDYGERELVFRPLASVATQEPLTSEPVNPGGLSFIGGSFGRTGAPQVREDASLRSEEITPPRSRWGVGYIAGVGPTDSVEESKPYELVGTLPVETPVLPTAQRDLRGLVSLVLATMILAVVGVAWSMNTGAGHAQVQTVVK